ncbi:hypothetical protein ABPG75_005803 [Micractinium tetrahymenae]
MYHHWDAPTDKQRKVLNDMGVIPTQVSMMNKTEASAYIGGHWREFMAFKAAHGGKRPVTGNQKEFLRTVYGINDLDPNMTCLEAMRKIDELKAAGYKGEPPATAEHARELLAATRAKQEDGARAS